MAAVFTCSIDDGHPSDMKAAELLWKHGIKGTFYVPILNREGPPVLEATVLREIAEVFEIGSHTYDHCYLNSATIKEAESQITRGKSRLEDIIGESVKGFCYPGGKFTQDHSKLVKSAGFSYARTTTNLCMDAGLCRFEIPTTIQFYPHSKAVYIRNFLQAGRWSKRAQTLMIALQTEHWIERVYTLFDYCREQQGTFHLWAHSNEIDRLQAWHELDRFFAYVASRVPPEQRLTNYQLAMTSLAGSMGMTDSRPGVTVR
jgi:hypothetical protein